MRPTSVLFIGTDCEKDRDGIYPCEFDAEKGILRRLQSISGISKPAFLICHPKLPVLYSVSEVPEGRVFSYSIGPGSELTFMNQRLTAGRTPCHLAIEDSGTILFCANYHSGSMIAFPLLEDGTIGELLGLHQHHEATGPNETRQEGPHCHSTTIDPSSRFAWVADLGTDRLVPYAFEGGSDDQLGVVRISSDVDMKTIQAGSGPRHFVFHPEEGNAYLANELGNTIAVFRYYMGSGELEEIQTISTLPDDFEEESFVADIHITPNGKYLYVTNRGHDSVGMFRIDEDDGSLIPLVPGHVSCGGHFPRNFAIHPGGEFVLVANQLSDSIVTFRIDPETGVLSPTGEVFEIPKPMCLEFWSKVSGE